MLGLQQIAWLEPQRLFKSCFLWSAIALLVVVTLVSGSRLPLAAAPAKQPPPLGETVPFVSNAYQYLTQMKAFLRRAGTALEPHRIVRMYLGPIKLYLVAGFASDKSGRLKVPAPGAEDTPPEARYWAGMNNLMHAHLACMYLTNKLAETYYREYAKHLERFPVGERVMRNVLGFLNNDIAEAAITSLCGTRILEVAPDLTPTLTRICTLDPASLREMAKWAMESKFTARASAGVVDVTGVFALNANTVPIAAWCIIELAKDLLLLESARTESYRPGNRGFQLHKGALVQAPTEVAYYNEHAWSADRHPATDEDGSVGKVPQFSMAGISGQRFPYGGVVSICSERHFAKQEIMMSIAMLVARFDVDFVECTTLDGALPSVRPAENGPLFVGTAAVPPDRDMKVGLRRLW
ncbi:hypothetical protein LY76DRAFT_677561 [Colletotrichum caudatum]|nr:hypothetical protein LY76DRAFT_677561 [Colletotrichum caudatum]